MRTRVVALIAATALLGVPAACGGDDDDAASDATSQPTATVASSALVGTWKERYFPFAVRFTADGKFVLDGDGSVDDGDEYQKGTYTVDGSKIKFLADEERPPGCAGQEWEWEVSRSESGRLSAELLQEVCQTKAGESYTLRKQTDS